jgi:hypothetical protein
MIYIIITKEKILEEYGLYPEDLPIEKRLNKNVPPKMTNKTTSVHTTIPTMARKRFHFAIEVK